MPRVCCKPRSPARLQNRSTVGVAARLSRYLQVLTQSKKMGKTGSPRRRSRTTRASTRPRSAAISRTSASSASGASATRSTGCSARSARSSAPRASTTSRSSAPAGSARRLRARRSSRARNHHRGRVRTDARKLGPPSAATRSPDYRRLKDVIRDKNIVVGVLAVPAVGGAEGRRRSRRRGRPDHLQLLRSPARRARRRDRAYLEPRGRAVARVVLPPRRSGRPVRILLWHGYLLGGTGSNVYTRALAREWSRAGHEVIVVCQERAPEQYDLGGARVVVPELPGGLLPVFVMDRYAGLEPKLLQDFTEAERARVCRGERGRAARVASCGPRLRQPRADGRPVGAASGVPFRVKAHGSELEYSMRGRPELEEWGAETLAAEARLSARSTSARCSRRSSASRARPRGAAGCRRRQVRLRGRERALADAGRGSAQRRTEPGKARNASRRRNADAA